MMIECMFHWVGEAGWVGASFGVHPPTAYRWFREGVRSPFGDDRGRGVSG